MSKAFGFASLRVGYAPQPGTAALLTARRAPAPISGPAADIAAAALREPRLGESRRRSRAQRLRAALSGRLHLRAEHRNFVAVLTDEPLAISWRSRDGRPGVRRRIRITLRSRPRTTSCACARRRAWDCAGSEATLVRTTTEPRSGSRDLDGTGRSRVETGIGYLDHLLTRSRSMPASTSTGCGRDLDVATTTPSRTCTRRSALRLAQALGDREGVARYAPPSCRWTSRVRRRRSTRQASHAEVELAFAGRPRRLARRHAPPARARAVAIEAGCTVHVEARGADDHNIAEAAYKALGQRSGRRSAGGEGIRPRRARVSGVRVAIADYGAGNLRSLARRSCVQEPSRW